mmetsp:Transcript_5698/g.8263  ORF Transcript_5698/g.8263 Transcript_5698/m.8263 type:complete len:541 (+) Transcript_5698:77-1699(+)
MLASMQNTKWALALTILISSLTGGICSSNNNINTGGSVNKVSGRAQMEFHQHMKDATDNSEKKNRQQRLQRDLLARAVPVPASESSKTTASEKKRVLAYNYDDLYNDNYVEEEADYGEYGFDVSSYSLKYASCSAITTFSDEAAAEDGTPALVTAQYIVFRLCPTDKCSDSSTYGCIDDYGEYMLPLGDWLYIMNTYRLEEYERYCEYCENCMNQEYYAQQQAENEAAAEDDGAAAGDDAAAGGYYRNLRSLEYVAGEACEFYEACKNYQSKCLAPGDDAAAANFGYQDHSAFFECQAYNLEDDAANPIYIGPHCAESKGKIVIAAYKDEYCTELDSDVDVSELTGWNINLKSLYTTDCISCQESTLPYQVVDGDNQDDDTISEVCENAYAASGKCNRHIGGATDASYNSEEQESNEVAVCDYINSVVTGSYNEYGYIYINAKKYRADNVDNEYRKYSKSNRHISPGQIVTIVLMAFTCSVLMVHSCILHKKLSDKLPAHRMPTLMNAAQKLTERQDSGIMLCRSKSVLATPNRSSGELA